MNTSLTLNYWAGPNPNFNSMYPPTTMYANGNTYMPPGGGNMWNNSGNPPVLSNVFSLLNGVDQQVYMLNYQLQLQQAMGTSQTGSSDDSDLMSMFMTLIKELLGSKNEASGDDTDQSYLDEAIEDDSNISKLYNQASTAYYKKEYTSASNYLSQTQSLLTDMTNKKNLITDSTMKDKVADMISVQTTAINSLKSQIQAQLAAANAPQSELDARKTQVTNEKTAVQYLQNHFDQIDTNKDNVLSQSEMQTYLTSHANDADMTSSLSTTLNLISTNANTFKLACSSDSVVVGQEYIFMSSDVAGRGISRDDLGTIMSKENSGSGLYLSEILNSLK